MTNAEAVTKDDVLKAANDLLSAGTQPFVDLGEQRLLDVLGAYCGRHADFQPFAGGMLKVGETRAHGEIFLLAGGGWSLGSNPGIPRTSLEILLAAGDLRPFLKALEKALKEKSEARGTVEEVLKILSAMRRFSPSAH